MSLTAAPQRSLAPFGVTKRQQSCVGMLAIPAGWLHSSRATDWLFQKGPRVSERGCDKIGAGIAQALRLIVGGRQGPSAYQDA